MAISFQCDCGKKMTAKEEFAGRRLRCPECQRVVSIPKTGSSVLLSPNAAPTTGRSGLLATLTPDEAAGMDFTRPIHETPPPSKTMPTYSPEDLPALLSPLAERTGPSAAPAKEPAAKTVHPWVDQTMIQSTTPWQPGDEQRYQADVAPARERESPLGWLTPVIVIAVAVAAASM